MLFDKIINLIRFCNLFFIKYIIVSQKIIKKITHKISDVSLKYLFALITLTYFNFVI